MYREFEVYAYHLIRDRTVENPNLVGFCSCGRELARRVILLIIGVTNWVIVLLRSLSIKMELNRKHCPCERAGIVVVNNRRASAVAVQTNCSKSKMEWRVNHAPEPKAVKLPRCSTLAAQVPVRQAVTVYFDSSSNSLLLHNHHFSCHSMIHRRHIRSKLQAISFISTT